MDFRNRHNFWWWCPLTLILQPIKSPNLSFLICYFSLNFDLRKVPKHWFWIETLDFQNSMKIAKSLILVAFLLVKSAFLWFSCNFGNRRSRFENSTKITKFNQNSTKNSKLESWDSGLSIGWRISVREHHHQKLWRFRNSTKVQKWIKKLWKSSKFIKNC